MSQLFDENGMLILRKQSELPKDNIAKKYAKHGSNFQKVLECLSQYNVGDKIKINIVRRSTQLIDIHFNCFERGRIHRL